MPTTGQVLLRINGKQIRSVSRGTPLTDALQELAVQHIRHLPVVEQGELVGLVSISDVVKAIITSHKFTIEQISKFIDGGG